MRFKVLVPLALLLFLFTSFRPAPNQGLEILQKVYTRNRTIHSVSLSMLMKERYGDKIVPKKADFKVMYKPVKIYVKQAYPNVGLEVLYVHGENGNKALVNPNAFPWATFKLDPLGNTMRKDNHHSIFKSGFDFFVQVLEYMSKKYSDEAANMVSYQGLVKYADILCHKISVDNPNFKYLPYKIVAGDNLESISRKFKICDYMIVENNPAIRSFEDLKPGMEILIPSDYGKQFTLYIKADDPIPIGVKVFDEKGLFEEYTYLNVKLNPGFTASDFVKTNPSYGFR